jgi:hypothetical protein
MGLIVFGDGRLRKNNKSLAGMRKLNGMKRVAFRETLSMLEV